jgi:hypothetical protein
MPAVVGVTGPAMAFGVGAVVVVGVVVDGPDIAPGGAIGVGVVGVAAGVAGADDGGWPPIGGPEVGCGSGGGCRPKVVMA